ncbi:hypothetical protein QTP70_034561 [Hemibagrus guttatus]|uniref:Uncharacterized protein n=1 Tax=Hemibagrus guttatus TaxID=175788 RepID=A0AAE0VDG4_9TELE|nr:hypothetical protein QTP70_034561 [Hemibagrus guttatus]
METSAWCLSAGPRYHEKGYRIKFTTLHFRACHYCWQTPNQVPLLLLLRAIEHFPIPDQDSGFYSWYFVVPRKMGAASNFGPAASKLCIEDFQVQDAHTQTYCAANQVQGLGIRVLNYLDDWLILDQLKAMAASH